MKRLMICSTLLLALAAVGPLAAESAGDLHPLQTTRPAEFEASLTAFYSQDSEVRLRAVKELSGWALDGKLREEALTFLQLARHDSDLSIVVQAEVALASLTGGDREAVRAAYGIVPPDPQKLSAEALTARTPEGRAKALTALGRWHRGSEIDTLMAATRDPDAAVRLRALEQLDEVAGGGSVDPQLGDAFRLAADDPDPAVRRLARSIVRSLK